MWTTAPPGPRRDETPCTPEHQLTPRSLRDEELDPRTVRALLDDQFPRWTDVPLDPRPVTGGTDHVLHRLGDDLVVRLPRSASAATQGEVESRWLPTMAPALPVPVPVPLARGRPGCGYPWPWSVVRWVRGVDATRAVVDDPRPLADDLAGLVRALHALDASEGPPPGEHNGHRGAPLAVRDAEVGLALAALRADPEPGIDVDDALEVWRDARDAPRHDGPPRWLHGDLLPGNLLVARGRLAGVIDFGLLAVGDPAVDLLPAWTLLPSTVRATFRREVAVDDDTWRRGRGWAVSFGLIALPFHRTRTPGLARVAHRAVVEAVGDTATD